MMVDEPALDIRDVLPFSAEAVLAVAFLLVIVAARARRCIRGAAGSPSPIPANRAKRPAGSAG